MSLLWNGHENLLFTLHVSKGAPLLPRLKALLVFSLFLVQILMSVTKWSVCATHMQPVETALVPTRVLAKLDTMGMEQHVEVRCNMLSYEQKECFIFCKNTLRKASMFVGLIM